MVSGNYNLLLYEILLCVYIYSMNGFILCSCIQKIKLSKYFSCVSVYNGKRFLKRFLNLF